MDEELRCPICHEFRQDNQHNQTLNHRFYFAKWSYNEYRKALISDRHGIRLNVAPEPINNFQIDFKYYKGKYTTKVTPEQLRLHNSTITYKCTIQNAKKDDPVYITSTDIIHPSSYFTTKHPHVFGDDERSFILLQPGEQYTFKVVFQTDILARASYKIPLTCDIQTESKKESFTIVRSFLTLVQSQGEKDEKKGKSPFTSQPWKEVTKTVPTTKELPYKDKYPIPGKYIKILTYGIGAYSGMTVTEEETLNTLSRLVAQLTRENYNRFWHVVLWLEERAQALMLMKFNMQGVTMSLRDDDVLILTVPGLAEKRPSVIVGDFIKIRITNDHTAYKGFVGAVNEKTVEISHVDNELLEYIRENPDIELDVAFMLSRLAFERMHAAVDKIVSSGLVAKLFPVERRLPRSANAHNLDNSTLFNKTIAQNPEQKNAVDKIVNNIQDIPYIVFGPPGTGKTVTIVEAILQIKKRTKKRILVCAPANSACDMLATKLMPHCTTEELIRINSTTRERTTMTEDLKEYSNMEDDEFTRVVIDRLLSYRIVVTTLTLIGRYATGYRPDCVFIDEAAQASEPESDIAIALAGVGKQVVLAGDPKQLGPMVTKSAEKFGLGKSLLERLMEFEVYQLNRTTRNYDTNFITMLRLNFRSHPRILEIPNNLFYDDLLKPVSRIALQDPIANIPIYAKIVSSCNNNGQAIEMCAISAKEQKEGSSPSFFNLPEAEMVGKYVKALVNLPLAEAYKVRLDQIGVVTPYKRQVFKIKEELMYKGYQEVEVGTTESFQGREKRIIIISTVRAQHSLLLHDRKYDLGFVKNDQRFNVAITRAISKLIVIGNTPVLRTDHKWNRFIQACEEHNTCFGHQLENSSNVFKTGVVKRTKRFKSKDDQYHR
ncbi:putative RNA helicase armi-like Protein [Tribolium castaneum]|uniref:RNA helicase n=1 Tax=Tribolium castaneum TaxID=7070 RepID=D6WC75_TRICA|nr:PREDICTED: putative helicase mov-10-B.1 [Tribolium castaneum]EEZ97839.2 putative RNA helicase armi-like Protein [Tribolium castaneum]|eukprot:XP_008190450.1 PREDICTED: putative helicase mov-10-B.1 [Tribolium castaneum]